jgi:hypothetical protein
MQMFMWPEEIALSNTMGTDGPSEQWQRADQFISILLKTRETPWGKEARGSATVGKHHKQDF